MKPKSTLRSFLCIASSALLTISYAHAATLYWDDNSTTAGAGATPTGTWGTDLNWNDDSTGGAGGTLTAATAATDDLYFVAGPSATSGNVAYAVTVDAALVANSLTFQASGGTTISGGTSITLGNGTAGVGGITMNQFAYGAVAQGAVTISTALSLANSQTWTNNSASVLKWTALNLGTGTLTFSGSGTFDAAAGTISATAGSIIHNGTGLVMLPRAGGSLAYTGTTTISGGGILMIDDSKPTGNFNVSNGMLTDYYQTAHIFSNGTGLGTGDNQIQIYGESGFGGGNGTSSWRIGANNSVLKWGTLAEGATGFFNPTTLKFLAPGADNMVTGGIHGLVSFQNGLDLNGAVRTIAVQTTSGTPLSSTATITGTIVNTNLITTAGLTKTGAGNLILSNTGNTYNGATTITSGALSAAATGSLGDSSATNTLIFNGGTLRATGAITSVATRAVTMTSTGIIDNNGQAISIAGNISGAGGLTKNSTGTLTLSGTNSYGGVTTVNAGTLAITKEASLASNTAANLNVKSGATLQLNVDSAGSAGFTSGNLTTLLGNISVANSASEGLQGGATLSLDTGTANGGSFTQGNAITNSTGASGGVINLTKLGAGILVLDKANTYTGLTTISGGTLQLNDGGSIPGSLVNNGVLLVNKTGALTMGTDFPANIGGSGSIAFGASATHTITTPAQFQYSALNTTGGGGVILSGVTTPVFGGLSGTTGDLATVVSSGYSGVTNLTLNTPSGTTFTYGGVIANGATGMSLTKTGAGTQILTGNNTYTGATFLNGGALHVGTGSTIGKLSGTTDLNFNGGTLQFNRSTAADIDAINNAATVTVNSSSTFSVTSADAGNANANETIGAVTLNAGQMNFNWTNGGSSGTQMILTSLSRSGTASANFNSGFASNNSRWKVAGAGTTTGGQIIGPWYTTGANNTGFASTDYAVYSSDFVAQANIAGTAETAWTTAANAYTVNAGAAGTGSAGLTGTRTITALRSISGANAMTVDNAANTFALTSNTFANGDAFILGGTAPGGLTAGNTYYVINKSGNTFQVASTPIGSFIDLTSNGSSVTATGAITLSSGNNLETYGLLNGVSTTTYVVAPGTGGVLTTPSGGGNLHVNAGAGAITVNAPINNNSGNVTLVKNGSNTLTLGSTTSTYSGGTVLNAGTVAISNNSHLGATGTGITFDGSASISSNVNTAVIDLGTRPITVNNGAVATFTGLGNVRADFTIGGAVTGAGGVSVSFVNFWGKFRFNSTANTFTGPIIDSRPGNDGIANALFSFNSIADGAGYGNIILSGANDSGIDYGSGAIAPLTLDHRQIILANNNTVFFNNASSQTVNINTDIGFGGTGARQIRFGISGRSGSGISTFAGKLTDNAGGALSPTFNGGTWVVSGSNNSYTGTTGVSGGTVTFSGNNSLTGQITISGSTGATLTLSGNNSGMTGNVVLSTATGTVGSSPLLNINSATALGTGTLQFGGGAATDVVRIDNTSAGAVSVSTANAITMNRNFTFVGTQDLSLGTGTATIGPASLVGNRSITVTAKTLTLNGTIAEAVANLGITKAGAGTLVLSGIGNSYTGATTVSAGTLAGVGSNAFGSTSGISMAAAGTLSLRGNTNTTFVKTSDSSLYTVNNSASGATINVDRVSGTGAATMTVGNLTTTSTAGTWGLNFTGANDVSLSAGTLDTPVSTVAAVHTITNNIAGVGSLTLASVNNRATTVASPNLVFAGTGTTIVTGPITQTQTDMDLIKNDAGTLLLNGINTYTGLTTVSAGTLGGTGVIAADVTVAAAGSLAPGASAGTLSIGGGLDISAPANGGAGKLKFELGPIANSDKIALTGSGSLTIGGTFLDFSDFNFSTLPGIQNGTYKLITSANAISGGLDTTPANLTGPIGAGTGTLQITGNDVELLVSGIGAGSAYDTWATSKGLTGAPGFESGKGDDPDKDGKNNLSEFAFDGNPLSGANDGKIVGKVATVGLDQVMTLTLPVRTGATFSDSSGDELSALIDGIYYRIEGDVNLSTFASNVTEVTGGAETPIQAGLPALTAGWTYRTFRDSGTVPTVPKVFLRAKISETP